jgi:hypothetical protein
VTKPAARQRALQQFDALRLPWKVFEGHERLKLQTVTAESD